MLILVCGAFINFANVLDVEYKDSGSVYINFVTGNYRVLKCSKEQANADILKSFNEQASHDERMLRLQLEQKAGK